MNYYANIETFEYKKANSFEECGEGSWALMPEKPSTLCSVGVDFTWQPPLPRLPDLYNWDEVNLTWVKR